MEILIISLISIAILLLIISFFTGSRTKDLEEQVEQLSLNFIQETYQLKKKMKVLEEELLIDEVDLKPASIPIKNETGTPPQYSDGLFTSQSRVLRLAEAGYSVHEIARSTARPVSEIEEIIQNNSKGDG
ncbi:hypothetical protein [Bacillus marinisedimentorum]|uniref:hypothetical protein n=1 Tax=Bacillus marinisedimentorum TaxID=1821260 RepID=UPI0007DFB56C|nr:hypothetical protein [Bacillus marinisedimentorum]